MSRKIIAVRGIRKAAHLSRRALSKGARFSERVETKASKIINGTDPTLHIRDKVLYEKVIAEALPEIVPIHPAMPIPGREPAVTLLIPSLQKSSFFGGTATALILAVQIAQKKSLGLRIVETLKAGRVEKIELTAFFKKAGFPISPAHISILDLAGRTYNHYGYLDMHPKDVFIASAWWDAYLLDKLPLLNKFIYLIQDFEPIFYNNSDQYVLAEDTYRKKSFVPICNTKLMRDFMQQRGYGSITDKTLYFEPSVNIGKQIGLSEPKSENQKKRMFLYGRPSVHRNLFNSAVLAINELFATNRLDPLHWEIFMAGQDKLPNILLDGGATITNLGKMDMDDYYKFAKTVDVAISPMLAPHPNYPTLELASIGASVVTTSYENKTNLENYSANIIMAKPTIDSLADCIFQATTKPYEARHRNAQNMNLPDSWQESMAGVIDTITKTV